MFKLYEDGQLSQWPMLLNQFKNEVNPHWHQARYRIGDPTLRSRTNCPQIVLRPLVDWVSKLFIYTVNGLSRWLISKWCFDSSYTLFATFLRAEFQEEGNSAAKNFNPSSFFQLESEQKQFSFAYRTYVQDSVYTCVLILVFTHAHNHMYEKPMSWVRYS